MSDLGERVLGCKDLVGQIVGKLACDRDRAAFSAAGVIPRNMTMLAMPHPVHFFGKDSVRTKVVPTTRPQRVILLSALEKMYKGRRSRPGVPPTQIARFPAYHYATYTRDDLELAITKRGQDTTVQQVASSSLAQSVLSVVIGLRGQSPDLETQLLRFVKLIHSRQDPEKLARARRHLSKTGMFIVAYFVGAI